MFEPTPEPTSEPTPEPTPIPSGGDTERVLIIRRNTFKIK